VSDNAQPSPFTRPGFIAAAIVVLLIVVAGGIAVVVGLTSQGDPDPTPTGTTGPGPSAEDESVCGLEGFETESSLTEAPDNEWELVGTVAAPTDPEVGPGVVRDDRLRTCFAHTAEGALYAAVNYFGAASDARTIPLILDLIADGPGKDAAAAAGSPSFDPSSTRVQIAGFKVNSYNSSEAVIDVALTVTTSGSQLVSMPIALVWQDGDWKLELADDGDFPFAAAPLQSLGGYIPWAGV
jgi:hypothetical protein